MNTMPNSILRKLYFNRKNNDFKSLTKKVGRRVIVDEAKFNQWIKGNNKNI